MTILDIIILALTAIGLIMGMRKGLLKQLASLLGLLAGLLVARALFSAGGEYLAPVLGVSLTVGQLIAFIAIWVAVPMAFTWVAGLLTKALRVIRLGWVNRFLGGVLGALMVLVSLGLFSYVMDYIDPQGEKFTKQMKEGSQLYEPIRECTATLFPLWNEVKEQIIDHGRTK